MIRSTLAILCGAALVTGCLFPSLDDMRGAPKGGLAEKGEADVTDANRGTTDGADAAAAAGGDASASTSTSTSTRGIACQADGGSCHADGESFCCATVGGPSCQGAGTEGFCTGVEGGKILRCDDRADCGGAGVCCFLAGAKEAACMPGCAGAVLCSKEDPTCPAGQTCSGVITHGGGFTSSFCQ